METATNKFPEWVSSKIADYYSEQGIGLLFDWQIDVLHEANENPGRNVVFSAPTSAGKSLVAELLAWKVAATGKKVLFVLPYISVAREKLHEVQRCWRRDDIPVCGFIGPQASNPNDWTGAVCTIEKAASLVNRALFEQWFGEIGLIVVDELHMVFDSSRGSHIEHLLAKILLWNLDREEKIRIVGMSATIPEIDRIGKWLNALVFEASFRPIPLKNHIVIGSEARESDNRTVVRHFPDDPLFLLAEESFRRDSQTLIMISSKMEAERVAMNITMKLKSMLKTDDSLMECLKKRADGLFFTKNGLERNGCKDRNLMANLSWAVAFHHAGLTMEEREIIELAFREKTIVLLVATSTLASGVNLPAERVIIKAQTRGPSALTALSYRQMVGRAGRTGHASRGESWLLVKKCDEEAVEKIISSSIDKVEKKRTCEATNLGRFILEGISTGLTSTRDQILQLCSQLLFASERDSDSVIDELFDSSFISTDGEILNATQLGRAAIASSLPPEAALSIFEDLNEASKAIALDTELHMLYLVTPINVTVWQECDWHHLFALFCKLPAEHRRIAKLVGVGEKFILEQIQGRNNDTLLKIHVRFFSALALFDLINEMSIYEVSNKYRIPRGSLQTLQSQSATYAAMIVAFCLRLGWTYLKALLDGFAMRLLFGIRSELSELVAIEGIDGQRARILHEKGITCFSQLSSCDSSKLAHYLTLAVPYSSSSSNDGLGEWLFGEPRMRLDEAANCLKERARHELARRIRQLGIVVELPKEAEASQDSGIGEISEERDVRTIDEVTKSVTEMSLVDSDEEGDEEVFLGPEEDEVVEETAIDCLDQSLLKLTAPKDRQFLKTLSQTFSPRIDDSFDRTVPGSVPMSSRTPQRSEFEDSFDRPVPGSVPLSVLTRKSILEGRRESLNSSIASENKSFDVFSTPPPKIEKQRRRRVDRIVESPLAVFSSSPVQKHPKWDPNKFLLEDVCHDATIWRTWLKSASSSPHCSFSLTDDYSGMAVNTTAGTTFISLREDAEKCVISLKMRIDCLNLLSKSTEVFIENLESAFILFEKFGIQIPNPKVLRIVAHLNHLIEAESDEKLFPMHLDQVSDWTFDIRSEHAASENQNKSALEAFASKRIFESMRTSAISYSSAHSVDLEIRASQTALRMFYTGISFSRSYCTLFIKTMRERLETLEEEIWRLSYGKFNINSSHEVANILFHRLGLVFPDSSSGSKARQRHLPTNKTILERMSGQHEVVGKILEYRHVQHTIAQCLLPLESYDERIHCWFEMCTSTGRLLTVRPNLQSVPKRTNSDGMSARHLFTASPGLILIGADYKQLELRMLAHLCDDPSLTDLIASDRDLFGELAIEWGFSRDGVKQLCYALIYGMGVKSLAEVTRMQIDEAEHMLQTFFARFPKVKTYINETKERMGRDGFVSTLLGRKKMTAMSKMGEEKGRIERAAVNYTIQGSASELFKCAIVEMEEKGKEYGARIVLTIHDEVLVECPIEHVDVVSQLIRRCMEGALSHLLRVPMRISLRTGPSWGSLQ